MEAVASQPVAQRRLELALQRRSAVASDNGGDASGSGRHDELVLRIADSGPGFGFDPSDETLFQSTKPAGSGLGLYVVRTTVANHHGRLEVRRSARHGGAEVSLVLPAAPQQTPLAGHTQAEDPGFDAARLRGKLIDQQPQRQADQPSGR
jgi:signal transduction histidine kinase